MKKYILGILVGFLCGLIAGLPWLIIYVYGGIILSLLAIPIALGVDFGYTKLKGPNKGRIAVVAILSVLIIVLLCLVIIPLALLSDAGYEASFYNLTMLYQSSEFVSTIIQDLILSVVFTFLGIGGVMNKIKREINPDSVENVAFLAAQEKQLELRETIIKTFNKYKAYDLEQALPKEQLQEIMLNNSLKREFNNMRLQGSIIKKQGKYFFNEKAIKDPKYFQKRTLEFIIVGIVLGIIIAILM